MQFAAAFGYRFKVHGISFELTDSINRKEYAYEVNLKIMEDISSE